MKLFVCGGKRKTEDFAQENKTFFKMIIAVFLITVIIVFTIQWYIKRKKFYKFADNIPSARNYGILGHGPHFLGKDDEGKGENKLCNRK